RRAHRVSRRRAVDRQARPPRLTTKPRAWPGALRATTPQQSVMAAFVVAAQVEAHVRIRIGAEILSVVGLIAVGRRRLRFGGLIVLRLILLRLPTAAGALRQCRRSNHCSERHGGNERLHDDLPSEFRVGCQYFSPRLAICVAGGSAATHKVLKAK